MSLTTTPIKTIRAPYASDAPATALKGSGNVPRRIAQVGITAWVKIPSLPVVRIGVLS